MLDSRIHIGAVTLNDVPEYQRRPVLLGMRWTLWLSALAVPFGAAINLVLARVGPEAIGVYGLLSVYVALVSSFLCFGGEAVVIKFIPECRREDRASFLLSYFLVILGFLAFWLVVAWVCPSAIRLVLGKSGGDRFNLLVLCLAPIPIAFSISSAALKGMLDIKCSQVLRKVLPVGSLFAYGMMSLFARSLLIHWPTRVIWSVYLLLTVALAVLGIVRLVRICGMPRLNFFLPEGFWRYAIGTQQVGMVSFLTSRLDYVLVLNFGGLKVLGRYVAVMVVASGVMLVNTFVLDTLLPSLTNTIASRNYSGASQVFIMHMRILFLVCTAVSCVIILLAGPATLIMGPKYSSIQSAIILVAAFAGVSSPGLVGGTLLSSIGEQRLVLWSNAIQASVFAIMFLLAWQRWNIFGAFIAYGVALAGSNVVLMTIAMRTVSFLPSIGGLWFKSAMTQIAVGFVALQWMFLNPVIATLLGFGAMAFFLKMSGYTRAECGAMAQMILPDFAQRWGCSSEPPPIDQIQSRVAVR